MGAYLVFGRTDYAEPLREVGALDAEGAGQARDRSLERFGRSWVELTLVPEAEVVWVLREREDEDDGDVGGE